MCWLYLPFWYWLTWYELNWTHISHITRTNLFSVTYSRRRATAPTRNLAKTRPANQEKQGFCAIRLGLRRRESAFAPRFCCCSHWSLVCRCARELKYSACACSTLSISTFSALLFILLFSLVSSLTFSRHFYSIFFVVFFLLRNFSPILSLPFSL